MTEKLTDYVNIRTVKPEDAKFIIESSITCLSKYTESLFKGWEYQQIRTYLTNIILYALANFEYSIFIACDKDDENKIYSYIVANTKTNHIFLQYSKYYFRKLGIQKTLLLPLVVNLDEPITVNWQTKEMLKLQEKGKVKIYNSFPEELNKKEIL